MPDKISTAQLIRQFAKFSAVGAFGTMGHYLVLIFLVEFAIAGPVVATTNGFIVGAAINYVLNYYYTFESKSKHFPTAMKFFFVALSGAIMNSVIMFVGTENYSINYIFVQVTATGIVLISNFILNRVWTFSDR